ncbi:MAG: hypothetical protein KDB22_01790 [Planctomycetales bacterium]|nr:hypothetical protein [Planctomycetales bacterium]
MNGHDPYPSEPAATDPSIVRECEQIIVELDSVIDDIDRYLHEFSARIPEAINNAIPHQSASTDSGSDQESEEWRTTRDLVEQRIQEQVDLLADAWLRLEDEQRSLQHAKEGLALQANNLADIGQPQAQILIGPQLAPGSGNLPLPTKAAAIHDFERLRQEVRKYSLDSKHAFQLSLGETTRGFSDEF